ncbi:MAG: hypothetical protein HQK59_06540 [Deltaproteobacteria bacterium]|nr:hypothetical protein [Deltaproteobacteria bacterium]
MKTSLQILLNEGRLRRHRSSIREVADLLRVVERDLADAGVQQLSADRRFATAYNGALQLATVALHAAGYRSAGTGHHWATIRVLPEIMGQEVQALADYLDYCRSKRNISDYDRAGEISEAEADELLEESKRFRSDLLSWLQVNHPDLLA